MELYVDGVLDTYKAFSGTLQASTKPLTIGRMDNVETQYAFRGSVDEFKLWDKEIPVSQIGELKNEWATEAGINENQPLAQIYPNPAGDMIYIEFSGTARAEKVSLFTPDGRKVYDCPVKSDDFRISIEIPRHPAGIYLLRIVLNDGNVLTRKIVTM